MRCGACCGCVRSVPARRRRPIEEAEALGLAGADLAEPSNSKRRAAERNSGADSTSSRLVSLRKRREVVPDDQRGLSAAVLRQLREPSSTDTDWRIKNSIARDTLASVIPMYRHYIRKDSSIRICMPVTAQGQAGSQITAGLGSWQRERTWMGTLKPNSFTQPQHHKTMN